MDWFQLTNPDSIASPGLVIDADRVAHNIQVMIATVGGDQYARRLRPHVKTYKIPEIVRMQLDAGIKQFKVATIAELKMAAGAGGEDLLLAYQPVGPNLDRLVELKSEFPDCTFGALTDNIDAARRIAGRLGDRENPFRLFIDVDCGMHRTGISMGSKMERLRDWIEEDSYVQFAGLHVYDGHVHDPPLSTRRETTMQTLQMVNEYHNYRPVPAVIGGGSPTFGVWAEQSDWQCSPGTSLLWDVGYGSAYAEMDFKIAAALLTRVISKPAESFLCLDLGHKSVAAEMPLEQRVTLPAIPDARFVSQSEEHLVVETQQAKEFSVGDPLLAFPKHICPTVALHAQASVVRSDRATGEVWRVTARDRI